ncbi:hypothetical protein L2D14_14950 [Thalassospiraceae bacterium LMO-JJ14]|nr:hypothetical protein L2D14_14950 [Thalassospiraceae bacterium LMO-JJ14]
MFDLRILKIFGVVCFSLVVLAGCRPEEQGRPLQYKPGVYPGKMPTSSLNEDDLAQLRQRSILQGGQQAALGGGGPTRGSDVRAPLVESDADKALQERGKFQGGN